MSKLAEFFKNRVVISVIGLIFLSLLIWFVGPLIKFGESNSAPLGSAVARLVTIMIILLIWGINNLRSQRRDKKQNEDLVADLQENQSTGMLSEQTSEEMHQINERFNQALATLKKLKFKGRGVKKALYELPWYIIIGPPGSGKTTALVNSSLHFPLAEQFGKASLKGVGGTRNCDWWFTNEAVLVDTAGRYTTQDSHRVVDSSAWEGFLNLLKRNRRRRPINGAIIAISLQDLLTQTEEERIQHAKVIRMRVDELMEKLEIRFPIYLMFTKSDLVSGFSEFYEDLGKDDREQVWGISLPNAPKASQSPDFEFIDHEYHKLIQRLYDRVLWFVHQERDVRRRGGIQGFPQQMENLKPMVMGFVQQTFVKNRYHLQPYLRGIYFTSGTQDGTPIDRLMSSVSSNFGFAREMMRAPSAQGKSFFLGNLFRQVIFPESELVGSNRRYERFMIWSQRAAYIGMAAVAIIMFVVWAGSFTRNELYMHEVESYVADYKSERKRIGTRVRDIRQTLPALNALGKASIVYDQEEHPWLSSFGMYDSNVDDNADAAYSGQLKSLFLPQLLKYLEVYLKRGHEGGDVYTTFRTYMMFHKLDHMEKQQVEEWFTEAWEKDFPGDATRRGELDKHLKALLALQLEPAPLNERLVASTRQLLLRVPVAKRVYGRIRTNPKYTEKVDMLNEFGDNVRNTFDITPDTNRRLATPWLFTKQGYKNIDLDPESDFIQTIMSEKWLLTDDQSKKVDWGTQDRDAVSKEVKALYLADYQQHWERIYDTLDVRPFQSIRHADEVLTTFTDPVYSPLQSILEVAKKHTELTNQSAANFADDNQGKGAKDKLIQGLADRVPLTNVDKRFRDLNQLLRESKRSAPPIRTIMQKVQQLQSYVNEIALAPEPGKAAFNSARARYASGASNPITQLRSYARTLPKPLDRWLTKLSDESWKVVVRSAHGYVNSEWRTRVYNPYSSTLAGRYPLKRSASSELALLDFVEFFKPDGTIDKFHKEFVKPFIRSNWGNRGIDGYSLGLHSDTLRQIRRAQTIKQIFFRQSQDVPGISFQLKPKHMGKRNARFTLEIGQQEISFSHGPKFWSTVKWVGNEEFNRVRMVFIDLQDRQLSKTYEGPWAWFKLQDSAELTKTTQANVYQVTYSINTRNKFQGNSSEFLDQAIQYYIKAGSSTNPFSGNLLNAFRLPERI